MERLVLSVKSWILAVNGVTWENMFAEILDPTGVQVLPYLACNKNDVDIIWEKMGFSRKEGEKISLYLTEKTLWFSSPKGGRTKEVAA